MMTTLDAMTEATRAGFKVERSDNSEGFVVITPKRPRHPSETHGDYKTEERAWFGACLMARDLAD
jgi:hypothetical protein